MLPCEVNVLQMRGFDEAGGLEGAPLAGRNPESTAGEQLGPVVPETDGRGAHRSL